MLAMGNASGNTIAQMKRANEIVLHGADLDVRLELIWREMNDCIERGLAQDGILPGGLQVHRRAKAILQQLLAERGGNQVQPHQASDRLSVFAMADERKI